MVNKLKKILKNIFDFVRGDFFPDPVKHCHIYLKHGCDDVDGPYCHFPKCDTLDKHMKEHREKGIPEDLYTKI